MTKKRNPKNNYIRKTYRKSRKTNRARRKTYRKKRRNKLSGGMKTQPRSPVAPTYSVENRRLELEADKRLRGDKIKERQRQRMMDEAMEMERNKERKKEMEMEMEMEAEKKSYNRIGFELEACFPRPPEMIDQSISDRAVDKLYTTLPCGEDYSVKHAINDTEFTYFDTDPDGSIECVGGQAKLQTQHTHSDSPTRLACSMELVLSEDYAFTYNDKQIYMDDVDITQSLIDEILTVTSMAVPCVAGTCGFHVHISSRNEKHGLDRKEGKIFLLRFLALWCGIEGQEVESEQNKFIKKGYVRKGAADAATAAHAHSASAGTAHAAHPAHPAHPAVGTGADAFARLLEPLDRKKFEEVYKLASEGDLKGRELETYLMEECFGGYDSARNHNINIYFFGTEKGQGWRNRTDRSYNSAERSARSRTSAVRQPLRIEFRGHKDLMENIMGDDRAEAYTESSVAQIKKMFPKYDHETARNLAKASRFNDHLMEYLEDINSLFERAKEYDPPLELL